MSRAFVKETDNQIVEIAGRPISPHPNFVTEEGRTAIEVAVQRFEAAYEAAMAKGDTQAVAADLREVRYWRARLASAQVVKSPDDNSHVVFGSLVRVRRHDGREQIFRIVGEDEADPSRGTISHVAPLARAAMGHVVGSTIEIGGEQAVILNIGPNA
jgi:transcription elongation GreA/GreB family factor